MLVEYIEERLPGWVRKRPHWLNAARAIALTVDAMIEGIYQARLASMPGQTDTPELGGFQSVDSLALTGRDRRIVRGFTETHSSYALRQRKWLSSHRRAGTARAILEQLAGVLGPDAPLMRIVSAGGRWWTRETDGTFVFNTGEGDGFRINTDGTTALEPGIAYPWDWDSLTVPPQPDQDDPARIWIIVYVPTNPPMDDDEGTWGDGTSYWADDDSTDGISATFACVEMIRGVAHEWRAAGIRLSHIIFAFNPASFDPLASFPDPGMPDGYWGQHGKLRNIGGGELAWVQSRLATARYVRGLAGTGF